MDFWNQLHHALRPIALCLALVAAPAWAVVEQGVEFPAADNVQGGTLVLDNGEEYKGEVRKDDEGRDMLVFILPDSASGARGTVEATVDGRPVNRSITVTGRAITLMTAGAAGVGRSGGFTFGLGPYIASHSTDVASNLASVSAAEATALLTDFGLQNIAATSSGDDSDTLLGVGILAGYEFPNGNEISFELARPISSIELDLSATATGDLPGFLVTAQSEGIVKLDLTIATLNYAGYFGASDFRYVLSGGGILIDRETNFTSTLDINNVVNSFSGGDNLEDSQLFYGGAIEWAPRRAGWGPVVGIGVSQSAASGDLENEKLTAMEIYFWWKR